MHYVGHFGLVHWSHGKSSGVTDVEEPRFKTGPMCVAC